MQKCRELNGEIVANAAKVSTALKLSQEDQNTIVALKKVRGEEFDFVFCNKSTEVNCIRSISFINFHIDMHFFIPLMKYFNNII